MMFCYIFLLFFSVYITDNKEPLYSLIRLIAGVYGVFRGFEKGAVFTKRLGTITLVLDPLL